MDVFGLQIEIWTIVEKNNVVFCPMVWVSSVCVCDWTLHPELFIYVWHELGVGRRVTAVK